MPLYHRDVFLPSNLRLPNGMFSVEYTGHAKEQANSDRYGKIDKLPTFIDTGKAEVIEVEVEKGYVQKIVYRQPLDSNRDISIVVIPFRSVWKVKTVWCNLNTDQHKNLDTRRYDRT